jgi:hypothetical protein
MKDQLLLVEIVVLEIEVFLEEVDLAVCRNMRL